MEALSREFAAESGRLEALHSNMLSGLGNMEQREERRAAELHTAVVEIDHRARDAAAMGHRAGEAMEAYNHSLRERDGVLSMLQTRVEALAEGLAAEARLRNEAMARLELVCQESRGREMALATLDERLHAAEVNAESARNSRLARPPSPTRPLPHRPLDETVLVNNVIEAPSAAGPPPRGSWSPMRERPNLHAKPITTTITPGADGRPHDWPMHVQVTTMAQGQTPMALPSSPKQVWVPGSGAATARLMHSAPPMQGMSPGRTAGGGPLCSCGSMFVSADAEYCWKCGAKRSRGVSPRRAEVYVDVVPKGGIPVSVEEVKW